MEAGACDEGHREKQVAALPPDRGLTSLPPTSELVAVFRQDVLLVSVLLPKKPEAANVYMFLCTYVHVYTCTHLCVYIYI